MGQLDANQLRDRLSIVLLDEAETYRDVARHIGISFGTFTRFMACKGDPFHKSLVKIKHYVERKEKSV